MIMDGTIHRTKIRNAKRPFPWGDVIIWAAVIATLLMLFRLGGVVTDFLYGAVGIYVYTLFLIIVICGICLKTGKRVHVNSQYFWGAMIMLLAFFTAMHVGFTQAVVDGGNDADFNNYINYCFAGALTPGGVLFALPSYLLLIISGTVGAYLLLGVAFLAGLILVVNRVIVKNREQRILTMEAKAQEEDTSRDFAKTTAELYEKLQMTNKEIMRENRRNFDANKSLLGLGALPKQDTTKTKAGSPISLNDLTNPEAINQASMNAAANATPGLRMYNDGVAIPWKGMDSNSWSNVQPTPTATPSVMPQMPTMGNSAYPYMPSANMPLSNGMTQMPRMAAQPMNPVQPTQPNPW